MINHDRLSFGRPYVTYDLPAGGKRLLQKASGYDATIVSGIVTYRDGTATGALPGQLIKGQREGAVLGCRVGCAMMSAVDEQGYADPANAQPCNAAYFFVAGPRRSVRSSLAGCNRALWRNISLILVGRWCFFSEVARSLVGHFLDRFHAVEREPMQSLPDLNVEYDAIADLACSLSRHQTAFLARFFAAGGGVFCFLAGAFPPAPSPMLRFRASIRLTTLLGFALAFACFTG